MRYRLTPRRHKKVFDPFEEEQDRLALLARAEEERIQREGSYLDRTRRVKPPNYSLPYGMHIKVPPRIWIQSKKAERKLPRKRRGAKLVRIGSYTSLAYAMRLPSPSNPDTQIGLAVASSKPNSDAVPIDPDEIPTDAATA